MIDWAQTIVNFVVWLAKNIIIIFQNVLQVFKIALKGVSYVTDFFISDNIPTIVLLGVSCVLAYWIIQFFRSTE